MHVTIGNGLPKKKTVISIDSAKPFESDTEIIDAQTDVDTKKKKR